MPEEKKVVTQSDAKGPESTSSAEPEAKAKTPSDPKASANSGRPPHPVTLGQKIGVALWLIVGLACIFVVWQRCVATVEHALHRETRVSWSAPTSIQLKPGPTTFWYDPEHQQLVSIGIIDTKEKADLVALYPAASQGASDGEAGYKAAIDALAFASNQTIEGLAVALLLLGGLSGAMGAQLRSITAFIGNACYTLNLDVVTWWPYYLLRPFTGFVLGIVVVVVIQAGFLSIGNGAPSETLWWVAVAILAGYSDDEFTQKLRQISKAIFGARESTADKDTGGVAQGGAAAPQGNARGAAQPVKQA